jgi:hypothetical protein
MGTLLSPFFYAQNIRRINTIKIVQFQEVSLYFLSQMIIIESIVRK